MSKTTSPERERVMILLLLFLQKQSCLLVLNSVTSTPQWIRQPEATWFFLSCTIHTSQEHMFFQPYEKTGEDTGLPCFPAYVRSMIPDKIDRMLVYVPKICADILREKHTDTQQMSPVCPSASLPARPGQPAVPWPGARGAGTFRHTHKSGMSGSSIRSHHAGFHPWPSRRPSRSIMDHPPL